MHRVWVINLEEAVGEAVSEDLLTQVCCRYLWCVNNGDYFISTIQIPKEYLNYFCNLDTLWESDYSWFIEIPNFADYDYTVDAILHYSAAFKQLLMLAQTGAYKIEPYIETQKIVELSEKTGLKAGLTDKELVSSGIINKLNNKIYFKEISSELGIRTIPGFVASNLDDIKDAVLQVCGQENDKAIIKISNSCGGCGNISGNMDYLSKKVINWYNGSEVLVEPVLNFVETLGSLAAITDQSIDYQGIDHQLIDNFCWVGCCFPHDISHFSEEIKACTIQYAETMQAMGGRGWLNLDWGIEYDRDGQYNLVAIEANVRHNGFKYILDVAKEIFRKKVQYAYIKYYMDYKISNKLKNFHALVEKTKSIKLNGERLLVTEVGANGGVVYLSSLNQSKTAIIIVGNSFEYITQAEKLIKEELSG